MYDASMNRAFPEYGTDDERPLTYDELLVRIEEMNDDLELCAQELEDMTAECERVRIRLETIKENLSGYRA